MNFIVNHFYTLPIASENLALLFIGIMLGLTLVWLLFGQEMALVLGTVSALVGYFAWGTPGIQIVMTKMYDVAQSHAFAAIPLLIFMANILTHSGIAGRLFLSVQNTLGAVHGGLGAAIIAIAAVFATITGVTSASVVTMGMLAIPIMLQYGYQRSFACGIVCAGGTLGALLPPSIMLVTMGCIANVSISQLFFATLIPGLLLALLYILYILIIAHIYPQKAPVLPKVQPQIQSPQSRILHTLKNIAPAILFVVVVLGGILSGITTPTEAAGMGALLALILALVYRAFSWRMLYSAILDTAKTSGMVFSILMGAAAFTGIFLSLDGDKHLANWIIGMGMNRWSAFVFMLIIIFILGMFIDWLGIIMLVFPIFLPITDLFGFDRLWVLTVTAVMLQTCSMTPPFGYALFYLKGVVQDKIELTDMYKGVLPFIGIILLMILALIIFPQIATWLPNQISNIKI